MSSWQRSGRVDPIDDKHWAASLAPPLLGRAPLVGLEPWNFRA